MTVTVISLKMRNYNLVMLQDFNKITFNSTTRSIAAKSAQNSFNVLFECFRKNEKNIREST